MDFIEDLISVPEAAKILDIDKSRVGRLCRQGRFKNARKIGDRWVIPRESVENFTRLAPGKRLHTKTHAAYGYLILKKAIKEADNLKGDQHS